MWNKPQPAMQVAMQGAVQKGGQSVGQLGGQQQNQQWQGQGQQGQHGQQWQPQHQQQLSWSQSQNQQQQSWGQQNNAQQHRQNHGQGKPHDGHHGDHGKPHKPSPKPDFDGWDALAADSEDEDDSFEAFMHGTGKFATGKKNKHQPASVLLHGGNTMSGFKGRSDRLINAPTGHGVRRHYLNAMLGPPLLSRSPFIPRAMVEHLMRRKKDAAISIKYMPGDAISNMEGVAHTFVTPIVLALMHGDYAYKGSHTVLPYAGRAREVVVSAAIQPDFEDTNGMMALARLEHYSIQGEDWKAWNQNIASPDEKYNNSMRVNYDARVRSHLIFHLIKRLPSLSEVQTLSVSQAIKHIEHGGTTKGMAVQLKKGVVSLELLFRSYVEALSNEIGALEATCLKYVYTSDPPAIFARECDATLLNRLQAAALKHLVNLNPGQIKNMRIFAFNDYADPQSVSYFASALLMTPTMVMSKSDLFPTSQGGYYWPPPEGRGCLLVLHNNSDAFGQNIETEGPGGSMDGAIGCNSSVAGSLRRNRHDLVSQIFERGARLPVW
ncbi:hypothetical protein CspHIS471_0606870 [Cutaneotrichosporon sp. HIS471]|nr:hypothetical protein CspHIS471_0606870 [Cutaneotrichosporon sp. HIS471]